MAIFNSYVKLPEGNLRILHFGFNLLWLSTDAWHSRHSILVFITSTYNKFNMDDSSCLFPILPNNPIPQQGPNMKNLWHTTGDFLESVTYIHHGFWRDLQAANTPLPGRPHQLPLVHPPPKSGSTCQERKSWLLISERWSAGDIQKWKKNNLVWLFK